MKRAEKYILFDICGTIYSSNTTFDFLRYTFAKSEKYQCFDRLSHSLLWKSINKISWKTFGYDLTRVIALKFLKGYRREELLERVEDFYDNFLFSRKNAFAISAIEKARDNDNCGLIFISATIDVVAEIIARRCGCKEYYSTQLEYNEGVCSGKIKIDLLGKKLKIVDDLELASNIDCFYTDDISDVPVLKLAKEKKIVVYPKYKEKWKKIVNKERWKADFIEV